MSRSSRAGLALLAFAGLAAACTPAAPGGGTGGGTGGTADIVKPSVISVDVSPLEVAPGGSFTISALVTDAVGVNTVAFAVRRNGAPAGFCSTTATLVSGTAQAGQWDLTCTAPAVVNSGSYQVNTAAADLANNAIVIGDGPVSGTSGHFSITGSTSDAVAPVVVSVTPAPTTIVRGSSFTISARVTDDTAVGAVLFQVRRNNSTPGWCVAQAALTSGTSIDGIWTYQCTVPVGAAAGNYTISTLTNDVLNNVAYLGDVASPTATSGNFTVTL
jgi:hypothetical protein